jgi:hypothetical protein
MELPEIKYIGWFHDIYSNIKISTGLYAVTAAPTRKTVIITDDEKILKKYKNFAYAIILSGDKFKKYIYPPMQPYKTTYRASSLPNTLNPPIFIETIGHFRVVRDDLLPGGTKQRAFMRYIGHQIKNGYTKFAYAGSGQGIGQVALGMAGRLLAVETNMFYSGKRNDLSYFTEQLGVKMHLIDGPLRECRESALRWQSEKPHKRLLLPFGLDDEFFTRCLAEALLQSIPTTDIKNMWLVGGSGVLMRTLYHVLPETYFHVIQVGRGISEHMVDTKRTQIFVHPEKFSTAAAVLPPYRSVDNFDAKVWFYAQKYGKPGDYIWNVAG